LFNLGRTDFCPLESYTVRKRDNTAFNALDAKENLAIGYLDLNGRADNTANF